MRTRKQADTDSRRALTADSIRAQWTDALGSPTMTATIPASISPAPGLNRFPSNTSLMSNRLVPLRGSLTWTPVRTVGRRQDTANLSDIRTELDTPAEIILPRDVYSSLLPDKPFTVCDWNPVQNQTEILRMDMQKGQT